MNLDFQRLIQDLSINLQQPLMEPVEDSCRISWDDIDMHIYHHEENSREFVVLTLDICGIPQGQELHFCNLMLQANYLWIGTEYATLSINPESQKVVLCDKEYFENIEVESLTKRVNELYQAAMYWYELITSNNNSISSGALTGNLSVDNKLGIKV
ncbi:type III secretion system chaperone [Microbulbifer sp. SSSA008]|uniref:type III secretion system chaperone n=1 Tax=Microbulbifer sp. SSSA008 TaxID=3243380 RepID=UPI004039234E